jgi:protein tyrosine/serine phosphatase
MVLLEFLSHSQKRIIRAVVAISIAAAIVTLVVYGHDYVIAKRFAEVVPGHLYRSGYLEKWPLERVLDQYHIRTILCMLNEAPDDPRQNQEREIAARKGVRIMHIGMRGDGVGDFDDLEKAAAILADASTHPVLVHCSAGVNRTGAVYAVWRMKYRGWDLPQAMAEAEYHGYSLKRNPKLAPHLARYYQERILTSQPASAPTSPRGTPTTRQAN